jgi:signal transduction histidine kinase
MTQKWINKAIKEINKLNWIYFEINPEKLWSYLTIIFLNLIRATKGCLLIFNANSGLIFHQQNKCQFKEDYCECFEQLKLSLNYFQNKNYVGYIKTKYKISGSYSFAHIKTSSRRYRIVVLGVARPYKKNKNSILEKLQLNLLLSTGNLAEMVLRQVEQRSLNKLTEKLLTANKLFDILECSTKGIADVLNADYVHILRLKTTNYENDSLEVLISTDQDILVGEKFSSNEGFSGWIVQNKDSLLALNLSSNVKEYEIISSNGIKYKVKPISKKPLEDERCVLGVPLIDRSKILGVILIASKQSPYAFDNLHDRILLKFFAELTGAAIIKSELRFDLESTNKILSEKYIQLQSHTSLLFESEIRTYYTHQIKHSLTHIIETYNTMKFFLNPVLDQFDQVKNFIKKPIPTIQLRKDSIELTSRLEANRNLIKKLLDRAELTKFNPKQNNYKKIIEDRIINPRLLTLKKYNFEYFLKLLDIEIFCDDFLLEQALGNILTNAIQAIEEVKKRRKTIWMNGYLRENNAVLEIGDTGIGMTEDTQRRLKKQEPFFTTKVSGSGLGLLMSRRIITLPIYHNGRLDFSSKEGIETIFSISLPINPFLK